MRSRYKKKNYTELLDYKKAILFDVAGLILDKDVTFNGLDKEINIYYLIKSKQREGYESVSKKNKRGFDCDLFFTKEPLVLPKNGMKYILNPEEIEIFETLKDAEQFFEFFNTHLTLDTRIENAEEKRI